MSYTYILQCSDGTLYTGWTDDFTRRLHSHNSGRGARYTRSRLPVVPVYCEWHEDMHGAMSREWHIKKMSREEKIRLIRKNP